MEKIEYCVFNEEMPCFDCDYCMDIYLEYKSFPLRDTFTEEIEQTFDTLRDTRNDIDKLLDEYYCLLAGVRHYLLEFNKIKTATEVDLKEKLDNLNKKIKKINEDYQRISSLIKENNCPNDEEDNNIEN